jgi:hypothetical protein
MISLKKVITLVMVLLLSLIGCVEQPAKSSIARHSSPKVERNRSSLSDAATHCCVILKLVIVNHLRRFFWDVDPDTFDPHAYPEYTIFRLLEFGDEEAIAWLRTEFPQGQIETVIRTERRLSPRSANFWALVYGLPPGEVAALLPRSH